MANINITVDTTTDLFTITLDIWEWTNLYIWQNGAWTPVPPYGGGNNIQFQYQQPAPSGPLKFKAVANHNIDIVNPPTLIFMKGPNADHTYMAAISYNDLNNEIHLLGTLTTFDELIPGAVSSPATFSQGRMTGQFQTN